MELALKQRLLGAVLLISFGVLVIPMLLDTQRQDLVRPLSEVAEPQALVFTHYAADAPEPVTQALPEAQDAAAPRFAPPENWFIQVGRFRNESKAREIRDAMREAGYPTDLYEKDTDGEIHQRIWVGPYATQDEAEHVLQGIKTKKSLSAAQQGWVVRQP